MSHGGQMEEAISRLTDLSGVLSLSIATSLKQFSEQLSDHVKTSGTDHDAIVRLTTISEMTLAEIRASRTEYAQQHERLAVKVGALEQNTAAAHIQAQHNSTAIETLSKEMKACEAARDLETAGIKVEVRELDRARWRIAGAAGAGAFMMTLIGGAVLKLVFK